MATLILQIDETTRKLAIDRLKNFITKQGFNFCYGIYNTKDLMEDFENYKTIKLKIPKTLHLPSHLFIIYNHYLLNGFEELSFLSKQKNCRVEVLILKDRIPSFSFLHACIRLSKIKVKRIDIPIGENIVISSNELLSGINIYNKAKEAGIGKCMVLRRIANYRCSDLYEEGKGRCYICGRFLNKLGNTLPWRNIGLDPTRDHAIPKSHGGKSADNLKLCCKWCNSHKGDRELTPELKKELRRKLKATHKQKESV